MSRAGSIELPKPRLPKELFEVSPADGARFAAYATAMYVGPATLAYFTVAAATLPLWAKLAILLPSWILAAQGLHLLGWVGHEGFHFNLHPRHRTSAAIGIVFSSLIMGFMQIGAAVSHKAHHAFTNRDGDPDIAIFTRFRSFWPRLLLGRISCNRIYLRNTFRLLVGGELNEYKAGPQFRWPTMRRLAALNVGCSLAFASLYALIAWHAPLAAAAAIGMPLVLGVLYTGLRSYVEHADTVAGDFVDSRTRTAPFFHLFYYFNNYHLEHHLYPNVPCRKLPQVHAFLKSQGALARDGVPIVRGVRVAYSYTTGSHQYPEADRAA